MDRQGQILMPPDYRHGGIKSAGEQKNVSHRFCWLSSTRFHFEKVSGIKENCDFDKGYVVLVDSYLINLNRNYRLLL